MKSAKALKTGVYKVQIRVYYEDTDAGGIVYHSNYLNFCERARSEIFFKIGKNPMDESGHFVVRKIEANFLSSAKLGDVLTVKTVIIEFKKASCTLLQQIYKEDELIFRATINLAYIKDGKAVKIPQEKIDILATF